MTNIVSSSPTIGVSCGHRVPREPIQDGSRKLYWCDDCSAYRMSGGKVTGERGFDFLLALRDEISSRGLVVDVDESLPSHGLAVIEAFGATVRRADAEPRLCKPEVAGSNPARSMTHHKRDCAT